MRPKNQVLATISEDEYQRMLPYLEEVTLERGQILHRSGAAPKSVYFLDEGVAAMSVRTDNGTELELSIVGPESTVGERAIFDYDFFIIECAMLTHGRGHKMPAGAFKKEFYSGGSLHDIVINNLEARITEASQTSLCNQSHTVEQRLCRWLLTLADRAATEELDITHEVIRKALGLSRSSITRAAVELKEKGMIDYSHGTIVIIDRFDLERQSCECYEVIEKALQAYRSIRRRPE